MKFCTIHIAILISLAIFLLSLTQDCMTYQYFRTVDYPSFYALVFGWMHFGGGGLSEGCIWLATPFYFTGLFLLHKKKVNTAVLSLIVSSVLALLFLTFENLTMTKSGRIAPIIELSSGYFLWLAAILLAAFSSVYLKLKNWTSKNINRNGL